jgi:hypothetical protein
MRRKQRRHADISGRRNPSAFPLCRKMFYSTT